MTTRTLYGLAAAGTLALLALFLGGRTEVTLSNDQLAILLFAGAVLWAYRLVARHFDEGGPG